MKRPRASTTGGGNNNGSTTAKRLKAPEKMNLLSLIMGHVSDHNFEDLWQAAFSIGTEWENMDKIREINWSFSNLEDAFEEGGELHGKSVYMFGSTESEMLSLNGEERPILIPVVVAVVSPIPPSDKVVITSVQRGKDEIIPMKTMKMSWVPYIPLENRLSQVERLKTQIFTLACTQRRFKLGCFWADIQSLEEDEDDDDTIVSIMFPLDLPIVTGFDWEMDDIEEFTDQLINNEELPEDKKDEFKEYLKGLVRDKKKAKRQFYPVQTPDTPDISRVKEQRYINRYYGKAHVVM